MLKRQEKLKQQIQENFLEKNKHIDFLKCYETFVNYVDDDNMLKKINVDTLITTGEHDIGSTP